VNDYRVVEAQTELDILRKAPEQDQDAIEAAMKKLELAIELRKLTSDGKIGGVV
jgi:Xaa-Pro aminopeptidase